MSFTEAIASCFRQYAGFTGRSMRSEFWWFYLFGALVGIVASVLDPTGVIYGLAALALLLPSLAVSARRLHDTNRSGWWFLIVFIPIVGIIVLIVWWATAGNPGSNRYGPPPTPAGSAPDPDAMAATEGVSGAAPTATRMECPRCGESIAASARVCRFCNYEISQP